MRKNTKDGRAASTLALMLALCASLFVTEAAAQSTDPNSPTPLTAGEIAGGAVAERTSYFFTFEGGPGEVSATLEAKMTKGEKGASVGVELFDATARSLASALVSGGLEGGTEKLEQELFKQLGKLTSAAASLGSDTKQKTARVKVKNRQPLMLKLTVDKGVERFTLKVGGAVAFSEAAPADSGVPTPTDTTGDTGAPQTDQTTPTDQATTAEEPTPTEQSPPTEQLPTTEPSPVSDTNPTSEAAPPTGEGQPKLFGTIVIPGRKKPAVLKIPSRQQTPAVIKIPARQQQPPPQQPPPLPPQQQMPQSKKPQGIKIPGKKQP